MLALMDADGNIAWSGEYDEWGNQLNEENPHHLHQPYRLPGQQYDKESGLYYNRNRYYDPLQGRYITQDPIALIRRKDQLNGNDSNLLIVFYVQIMPDDFVMQLHRF